MTTMTDTAPSASLAVPYTLIPRKDVHWFWDGKIPFRHVTLVLGEAGTSKGIGCLDLGARMTRHDPAPGEDEASYDGPMDIILIAPEDDPNETVAGRLEGNGAVLDRVHNLTVLPDGQLFTVPTGTPAIEQAIQEIEYEKLADGTLVPRIAADGYPHQVGMVILDPLLALADVNMNTRAKARPVIEQLEAVAKKNHLVILLTNHTNGDGRSAGSKAIVETVRNQLTLSRLPKAPQDSPIRLCTVTKTNIGKTGVVERYVLTGPIESPLIIWTCEVPQEDASRGYDVAPSQLAAAQPAPHNGIAADKRYRALHKGADGPQVIADYQTPDQARQACEQHAGKSLAFKPTPVPGMEGVVITDQQGVVHQYGVLDRYVKAAAQPAAGKHAA